ncbi:unnamed protein product [Hyaloperonospora brassicae]|uniref:PH domain-containing protein n=1 Tax=Hyaloperonospora brassicae TaxID=162125 RepID=A0AAV0SYU6_HYABA|nr:unnamed protein product [Hyaloperonospora brassicae]
MKMRICRLFWHKVIVSLKIIARQRPCLLTIVRPRAIGGKLEIHLQQNVSRLTSVSGKEARRHQLRIRYGTWHQSVTLRAPTSAVFETWWAALENALAMPYFVTVPIVDARARQVTVAPVIPARRNKARHKQTAMLEAVIGEKSEGAMLDDMPMLEAKKGPSSLAEMDVLASWKTWDSLDYFANVPSISGPQTLPTVAGTSNDNVSSNASDSDEKSPHNDISEFWSRSSEWKGGAHEQHLHLGPSRTVCALRSDNSHH